MDIGRDNGLGRRPRLTKTPQTRSPAPVKQVMFDLKPDTREEAKALHDAPQHASLAHGAAA